MRVIAGKYRGQPLRGRVPDGVRPTLDAARESIFNILQNDGSIEGAAVADIFAGTGALALEALSRGAQHATLVEHNSKVIRCIEENIRGLQLTEQQVSVVHDDALRFLSTCTSTFDLIFIDPPYAMMTLNAALGIIVARGLLRPQGVIVAEHGFAEHILAPSTFQMLRRREFGETVVDILLYTAAEASAP